jgi:hypothetical protein
MPVQILNKNFLDVTGSNTPYYISNSGDRLTFELTIESVIRATTLSGPFFLDGVLNTITSSNFDFYAEGFRIGDTVQITQRDTYGTSINTWTTGLNFVDADTLDVGTMISWYNPGAGEWLEVVSLRRRGDMEIYFNHVLNSGSGSAASLIDGQATRATFTGLSTLLVGNTVIGNLVGFQSGQFLESAEIERLPDPAGVGFTSFKLTLIFSNSGLYSAAWFTSLECLKVYLKLLWSATGSEIANRYEYIFNDDANTGYLNEPHNTDVIDATLIQGLNSIDYQNPTTGDIIVSGTFSFLGIGAAYMPIEDAYFKNRPFSQSNITMLTASRDVSTPLSTSFLNEYGAAYNILINSVTTVGLLTTINVTITPNPAFYTFIDGRDEGDRLFYVWLKAGNLNLTVFSDQLEILPPVGGPLIMVNSYAFKDHSENTINTNLDSDLYEANIEDDLAYSGRFLLNKNEVIELFEVEIIAQDAATLDEFTLQKVVYNFSGVPVSGDGRYLLNESQNIITSLPLTSEKRNSSLILDPSLNTLTQYGVQIYYPFLLRWEDWLTQINANVDFWPNQTKNWTPYDDLGTWGVKLRLTLVKNGLSYIHYRDVVIKDYDSDPIIDQQIELFIDSSNLNVGIVTEGLLMRVVATHTLTDASSWDTLATWGQITVEPFQSAQRHILSTVVPFDNNTANPLTPLSGLLMPITYPAPNIARMECYFNPDAINLVNGCKFTTKIKQNCKGEAGIVKTTSPDDIDKTTTAGIQKTLSI